MGWRGVLREMEASGRRAGREAQRQHRADEKQRRIDERAEAIEQAHHEVEVHNEVIDIVGSVHRDCGPEWDWAALRDAPPPLVPQLADAHQQQARNALDTYTPTFWDWFLARGGDRREELKAAIKTARVKDREVYVDDVKEHKDRLARWADGVEFAKRVLDGDLEAYIIAINDLGAFSELFIAKTSLYISIPKPNAVQIDFDADADTVVPITVKKVLATGALSVKEMPSKDYHALYRDYVCGCVLRVAREVFAVLPVDEAIVTAHRKRPNLRTGHVEQQPIASAAVPRQTLSQIRWDLVHPTMGMTNFLHRMRFDDSKGVLSISPIDHLET